MIDSQGWVAWCVKKPGPRDKVYSAPNAIQGFALHSQEGWQHGSESRLFSNERDANGRYTRYAAASWHFSVLRTGEVRQHYPLPKSTWTSSSVDWNTRYPSIEAEGLFNQPLTDAQVQAIQRLFKDVEQKYGVVPKREQPGRTLHEHRENPAAETACPSERYRPLYVALASPQEEEDMTEAEVIALLDKLAKDGGFGDRGHVGALQAVQAFNQRLKSHESLPKHGGAAGVNHWHQLDALDLGDTNTTKPIEEEA